MMNPDHQRKTVYHDNSLSSFITGIVIGGMAALMFGTKEGRQITKKLKRNISQLAKEIEPHLEDLPQTAEKFVNTIKQGQSQPSGGDLTPLPPDLRPPDSPPRVADHLHRSTTSFTQGGKRL